MATEAPEVTEVIERVNTYAAYQRQEGIPVYRGFAIEDLTTLELAPWARRGGLGAFINLDGTGGTNDAYVCEIPPGGSLAPQRQLYEEMIYVLAGNGATQVWYDERHKVTFEWQAGSLFAIQLNAWHRHYNGRGDRPARYVAVTNAPLVMNLFHNLRFVFETDFVFEDRFAGQADYFEGEGRLYRTRRGRFVLETNFVPDTRNIQLYLWKERGAGGRNIMFELAHNTMAAHISEFPVGTYKKAHRHGPGAHVIILSGEGYSLMWPEGAPEFTEVPWKPGTMFVPPGMWWHQHFNTGPTPARYLAIRWGGAKWKVARYLDIQGVDKSQKEGGNQIEYEDQGPRVHRMFVERCAARGVPVRMDAFPVRV